MKSDEELQKDVEAELRSDPAVHPERIGMAVKKGVVQLEGEVGSSGEKDAADQAALRTEGVRALASEIKVTSNREGFETDRGIARLAMDSLT